MVRSATNQFASQVSEETWDNIRILLLWGNRVVDLARVYECRGVTSTAIYCRNSRDWRIPIKRGVSRGRRCLGCRKIKPNYRAGLCLDCYRESRRVEIPYEGERHHFWKGGKTKTAEFIRFTPEYKAWRRAVFERDDYTCQDCGARGVYLHAHHIKAQSTHPELRFEIDNGLTLCIECHKLTDNYGQKAKATA